jgi:DNA replication protein DnaC
MTAAAKLLEGRVELDKTREALAQLGFLFLGDRLLELLTEAAKENWAPHQFLDRLLVAELRMREEKRIRGWLLSSGLPPGQTLSTFDWTFQPSVERKRLEVLSTCAWIRQSETVLLQGPPGVGKTHLAVGLGVQAIQNGFSVAFYRIEELLHALKRDAESPPARLRAKKYIKVALLVIDEMGYQPMNQHEANLFFRLVSYRYQHGATLITTNKSIKDWPGMLAGDDVMATALLDRLLHRSHVLNIKGRSYRLKELEKLLK